MEEHHPHIDKHHVKRRTRWLFSLIFIPISVFLIKPFIAKQLIYRASSYASYGLYREAIRQYKKALFIDKHNSEILNDLADCYKRIGDVEKAQGTYKKAIEIDQQNRRSYYSLGIAFALNKKYKEAVGYLNQVQKLGPESEKDNYTMSYYKLSFSVLAACYERLNNFDKAISTLEELISRYPDDKEAEKAAEKLRKLRELDNGKNQQQEY